MTTDDAQPPVDAQPLADADTTAPPADTAAVTDTAAVARTTEAAGWWDGPIGRWVALGLALAAVAVMTLTSLGRLGVWEPWEMYPLEVAREYAERPPAPPEASLPPDAPSYSWAVPTHQGKPVATSLLQVMLVSRMLPASSTPIAQVVGELERNGRLPVALGVALLAMFLFMFLRRHVGGLAAWMAAAGLVSLPVVYVGVVSLATPLSYLITTSLALLAFMSWLLADDERARWGWAGAFGVALALVALDMRWWGLVLVLGVIVTFALTQLADDPDALPELRVRVIAGALAAAPLLRLFLLATGGADAAVAFLSKPSVQQIYLVSFPACWLVAGLLLARKTAVGRMLLSPRGALALGVPALVVFITLTAYADVNPTLLRQGVIQGKIPVLTFMLEHHLFTPSLAKDHMPFDLWLRQIGFATFPLAALVPLALGYLADSARPDDAEATSPTRTLRRFLLVWAAMSLPIMAAASISHHYLFPSYVPLVAGAAMLCADEAFWARARKHPLLPYTMGFLAIAIIVMIGKDLERFPRRYFELFLTLQEKAPLPDDFSFGKWLKRLKYVWMLALMATFFSPLSWALLTLRDLRALPQRLKRWRTWGDPPDEAGPSPMTQRALDKEALRQSDGLIARLLRLIETPQGMGPALFGLALVTAVVFMAAFVPMASIHLSQRHLFQSYITHAKPGEPLIGYQTSPTSQSFYLSGLERVTSRDDFLKRYKGDQRLFAIIPRERLGAVNAEVRSTTNANVPALNTRSSRLVLISNKLLPGESDESFVTRAIVPPDAVQRPLAFDGPGGQKVAPMLDDTLQLVGYGLNRPADQKTPTYRWGETIKLSLYFKVLKRVPTKKKIFVHIDTRGNRLHGDHYPVNDEYPTNAWVPGDIIVDTHDIPVGAYSNPGTYTILIGLFQGSKRMKITPKSANDGADRVALGRLVVKP